MSVSARTFQLLYIIRQRALQDEPTCLQDFSDFIADRRKTAPALYGSAYIAPSAIADLLSRMTFENLVTATNGEYQLEHMGSQMADLLTNIDACSTRFIENYKEMVVHAALDQWTRLSLGPATQRDLAATTNISLDSVRRGLETLVTQGIVEETTSGRSQTYTLARPPVVTPALDAPFTQNVNATPPLDLDLKDIDEPRTLDPDLKAVLDHIDDPVPLGTVLQDDGPDMEPPAAVVTQDETPEPQPPLDEEEDYEESPYDWEEVPVPVRDALYIQAEAAGMELGEYLLLLAETNERRIQRALMGQDENIIRTLMNEVLTLQRQNVHLRARANRAVRPHEG